jgi:periplasmic divalent cation tolerance protein
MPMEDVMNHTTFVVLFCTTGSQEEALKIADHLVEARLAACVNIIPSVQSVYRWKNEISRDTEFLMVIKTAAARVSEIEKAVRSLHSYETPELISFNITYGLPEYLKWLEDSVIHDET